LHISTLGIAGVRDSGSVPNSATDMHDLHVVAVEMHGMGDWCGIVDYDADGGVAAEVFDVPFWLVGEVYGECEEDKVVVVCAKGGAIHSPDGMASGIDFNVDVEVSGGCWTGGGCDGVIRGTVLERSSFAYVPGSGTFQAVLVGAFGGVGFLIVDGC